MFDPGDAKEPPEGAPGDRAGTLAATLLAGPPRPEPPPRGLARAWAVLSMAVGSLIFSYHGIVLIAWNTPSKAVGRTWNSQVMKYTKGRTYFRATGSSQSWSMFAPNPNRYNNFIRVLITTHDGEMWDMDHDIHGKHRYPYLWYDRMGKINRRLNGKAGYQRDYGAWVCRQWERDHGELPARVSFVRRYYRIPEPWDNTHRTGPLRLAYHPWKMPYTDLEQEQLDCTKIEHGQNPDYLRERYGLPPAPEGVVREPRIITWYDQAKRQTEMLERKAKLEAERARLGTKKPATALPGATRQGGLPRADTPPVQARPPDPR